MYMVLKTIWIIKDKRVVRAVTNRRNFLPVVHSKLVPAGLLPEENQNMDEEHNEKIVLTMKAQKM